MTNHSRYLDTWNTIKLGMDEDADAVYSKVMGAAILISCPLIGTLLNALALAYFLQRPDIFNIIFRFISGLDIVICLMSTFVALSYLNNRDPMAFQFQPLCDVWGITWRFLTQFSGGL